MKPATGTEPLADRGTLTQVDPATGEVVRDFGDFALESGEPGVVPERVISELRRSRANAKDYAQAFSDAVTAQATKYSIKPGALKRYIVALEADKVDELDAETDDLERLLK